MIMNFNFNYKKILKYLLIFGIFYFVFNSVNTRAMEIVDNSNVLMGDATNSFSNVWNKGSINDAINLNYNSYISDLRDTIQNRAITQTNSTDFADFSNNYYYAIVLSFNRNNTTNKTVYMNLYYRSKQDGDFHFNFNFWATSALTNSTTVINGSFYPNVASNQIYSYGVTQRADGSNYATSTSAYQNNWEFHKNSSGSYYGSFSLDNNVFSVNFNTFLLKDSTSIATDFYIDCNINKSLYFGNLNFIIGSNRYNFETLTVNHLDGTTPITKNYSIDDVIFSSTFFPEPNIQDLGNNSFGINNNYVLVGFQDHSIFPIFERNIICPVDRLLTNDICYIYNTDIENFDFSNLNYNNRIRYFFGDNTNIPLRANYYYILTFRVYSPYNLSIQSIRASSGNLNSPTNITNVVLKDYFTYREYQVIFTPNVYSDLSVNFIDIYFNNYENLTDVLSDNISFGSFNFVKYSEFDHEPTDLEINTDYNTNNLDTISTNTDSSFFTNFNINDRGLSQIVLLPLNFVRSWTTATCSPINLPLPHLATAQLPCLSNIFSLYFGDFWNLYKIIINGIIIYRICISLLHIIKNIYNFNNDEIEVVDL